MKRVIHRGILFLLIGLWLCAVGLGLEYLWAYEVSAGTAVTPVYGCDLLGKDLHACPTTKTN